MISIEKIEEQLNKAKDDLKYIEDSVDMITLKNPFIEDNQGVPSSKLLNIIQHQVENIFLDINPLLTEEELKDIVSYYIWESNFGGFVESEKNGEYNLEMVPELVAFLRMEYHV